MQDNFKGWVLEFLRKSGEISLEAQEKANAIFKDQKVDSIVQPETIVTETDLKISALFEEYINNHTDDKHVVIDEEKVPNSKEFLEKHKNTEYVWTIDPIDGTRTYYQGFPLWGTLISLFKKGEPILSACYLPAEKGLVFATEQEGFFLKNAFTTEEIKTPLGDFHHDLTPHSVIITPSWLRYSNNGHAHYDRDVYGMLDVYSSAEAIFSVHTGRAHGAFFGATASLWDIAATILLGKYSGVKLMEWKTGKEITTLDFKSLKVRDDWVLGNVFLACRENDFSEISKILYPPKK